MTMKMLISSLVALSIFGSIGAATAAEWRGDTKDFYQQFDREQR
jgi:hypothetical protein